MYKRQAEGKGLGHEFLRHVERTALILHVVDLTGGFEGRDPVEDYEIIKRELALYAPELACLLYTSRRWAVVSRVQPVWRGVPQGEAHGVGEA